MINNIFCVGRNYALHAKELNNAVPSSPMFFSKPSHAAIEMNGQKIVLPADQGTIHYEAEWVVRVGRKWESGIRADELIDGMALGIDFTLRDVQTELKKKGHPWLLAKGFKNSAALTPFINFPGTATCTKTDFSMKKNGQEVQRGNLTQMIFDPQTLLDFCGQHFGLDKGDILFTGTPQGVGKVENGDTFLLEWGNKILGTGTVALE